MCYKPADDNVIHNTIDIAVAYIQFIEKQYYNDQLDNNNNNDCMIIIIAVYTT